MDYTKQCWSCKGRTMKKIGSFYTCSACGATHVPDFNLQTYIGVVSESGGDRGTRKLKPVRMRGKVKGGPSHPAIKRF